MISFALGDKLVEESKAPRRERVA